MSRDPDYILDIAGLRTPDSSAASVHEACSKEARPNALYQRPWLAVHWRCCQTYSRIYRSADGRFYRGTCPLCGKPVQAKVGAGGTRTRFFQAG